MPLLLNEFAKIVRNKVIHVQCTTHNGRILFYTCTLTKTKLRGLSPQANYTDRATAACRRS
jgi:hypothetical protein